MPSSRLTLFFDSRPAKSSQSSPSCRGCITTELNTKMHFAQQATSLQHNCVVIGGACTLWAVYAWNDVVMIGCHELIEVCRIYACARASTLTPLNVSCTGNSGSI